MDAAPQELVDLARNWARAGHARDGELLASMSRPPSPDAVFTIASAPEAILTLGELTEHLTEVIPCPLRHSEPAGFVDGDFAWLVDTPDVDIPGEGTIHLRITTILRREDGEWKVVHGHLSEGVAHLVND
ncbi:nuclear transport factor 2 family protein [Streptomyces samsunensis]|uniref:nuclear transport factor 2 family protein n=1 Tax=Streptomyces malaysiensis TaxID=92644 RepID=UPI0015842269|nr:nuclear transport factor 2 family protein [Streptomyces samsunensis]NUH40149.1 nuclear transport factor 2 family protein [Streptomyces samsunensis]